MADLLQPLPLRSFGDRFGSLRRAAWFRPVVTAGGAVLALGVLVVVGMAFLRSAPSPPRLTLPRAEPGSAPPAEAAGSSPGAAQPVAGSTVPPASPVTVTVHVTGQVVHPGVYAVASGGRVADAIVAAGGPSAEADSQQLNLAARVADGERVYVPKQGEPSPPAVVGAQSGGASAPGSPPGPVDLNTATAEQLETLPGVGPSTSKAILTYRAGHGRFRSVTELLEVPGIGPAKLEALRPLVRV